MTRIVHGLWLPSTHPDRTYAGRMALWGESLHPRRGASAVEHPYSLSTANLDVLLINLRFYRTSAQRTQVHYLTLVLPSDKKRPLSVNPAQAEKIIQHLSRKAAPSTLRAWRVDAVLLEPAQAFTVLLQLPDDSATITIGNDLRYWARVAHLTGTALLRGQFLPSANEAGRGEWRMMLTSADLQIAKAQLAQAMPPATRALAQPLPTPAQLVDDFVNTVGGEIVAQTHAPSQSPFMAPSAYGPRAHQPLHPADGWWMDLFPRKRYYYYDAPPPLPPALRAQFGEQVRAWVAPIFNYLASPLRLVLRLEPPAALAETIDPTIPDWRLSFHLQPKDQPETLWAAAEIWEAPPAPEMPAILLAGLTQAQSVYPLLSLAADTPQPTGLWLTVAEAFEFLEQHSAELNARGFGVLVPMWWKERSRKLSARLALGQATEGSGLLGLNALVDFNWELAIGDKTLTPEEFLKLAQSKTALVQVRGEWMQLDPTEVQAALKLMQRHQKAKGKLTMGEALGLALTGPTQWEGLEVESVRVEGWLTEMTRRLSGHEPLEPLSQSKGFVGQLRPYQTNGLSWLHFMRRYGFGACLADDMGLGKTVQMLALLQKDADEGRLTKPVLLICPTTVVGNWVRETEHFTPRLKCYAHHGPARRKAGAFAQAATEHQLVITSYALLPRDFEFLNAVEWGAVVLDEAHNIKNPVTKQAQAARQLSAPARFALTGTPVENRLQDLWSIMQFLNPGYLGSAETFQRQFAGPIERTGDARASARLRAITQPFILRRLKTDQSIIRDLPPKNEMKEYCGLTKEQGALYKAVVQESLRQIAAAEGIQRRGIILATLTKLKQVCNHPRHLLGDLSALKHRSGKLNRLTEMLEQALAEDDRCLIFTQYAEMGELLYGYLTEHFGQTLYLHGGTPAVKRSEMIDHFQNNGARLFVLSLKAGGAGINLTRANRVFHYDRWWNPAVENQATDRAFRIGQTQTVQVHKFICRGTLEERVDELITRKTALAEQIVGAGESWLTELTTDELRDLLVLRREAIDD